CIATAISLKHSITKQDLLKHEAGKLQKNLSAQEQVARDFLLDSVQVERARHFDADDNLSLNFINATKVEGINILVYFNMELRFWSSYKAFPPDVSKLKEGTSFVHLQNGWYEAVKKTSGDHIIVFLIDVKTQYSIENKYLKNEISPKLSTSN